MVASTCRHVARRDDKLVQGCEVPATLTAPSMRMRASTATDRASDGPMQSALAAQKHRGRVQSPLVSSSTPIHDGREALWHPAPLGDASPKASEPSPL